MTDTDMDDVQEIVINNCYGGFSIDTDVVEWMREQGCANAKACTMPGETFSDGSGPLSERRESIHAFEMPRDDPHLVEAVERFDDPGDACAELKIVEVPADVDWTISEYDGFEKVEEVHRSWG